MADGVFEAWLSPAARRYRERLSESERAEIDQIINLIELDPAIDGRYIFLFKPANQTYALYDNNRWRITFRIVEQRVIDVAAISRVDPRHRDLHLRL